MPESGKGRRYGQAAVLENRAVSPGHYFIRLGLEDGHQQPRPGQFYMVSVGAPGSTDPLLRRPLSLHRVFPDGSFSLLYRVAGRGTSMLSRRAGGDHVSVLGPLGNGFPLNPGNLPRVMVVGGGIGIVPLVALTESLVGRESRGVSPSSVDVVLGARTREELLCVDDFRVLGIEPRLATDDGSLGSRGPVTELAAALLAEGGRGAESFVYGCGPRPMLRVLGEILGRFGVSGVFSLEEHMACGLGACLGCVADTTGGRKRVCVEGPVFPVSEIVWGVDLP